MRGWIIPLALLAVACAEEMSPEERAQADAEAISEVQKANMPPPMPVVLEAMDFGDIEREDMFGVGCSFFADGRSQELVAIALLRAGYLKIDGQIEAFAPDAGSPDTVFGTKTKFDSAHRSMEWVMLDSEGKQVGVETVEYRATLRLNDKHGRTVFEQSGNAQCGS